MSRENQGRSNQETLGSGCICEHGCDSCDRLAEAFNAMRDALITVPRPLLKTDRGYGFFNAMMTTWHSQKRRPALDKVKALFAKVRHAAD